MRTEPPPPSLCNALQQISPLRSPPFPTAPQALKATTRAANLVAPLLGKKGERAREDDMGPQVPRASHAEIILLNSLKGLLSAAPQLEATLRTWTGPALAHMGGAAPPTQAAAHPAGAQFAQIMKELRSEYGAAVKNTVDRLASLLMLNRPFSLRTMLTHLAKQAGSAANAANPLPPLSQMLSPLTVALTDIMSQSRPLHPRVFVSVIRGLWDAFGRDVLEFAEALKESKENHGAPACPFISSLRLRHFLILSCML